MGPQHIKNDAKNNNKAVTAPPELEDEFSQQRDVAVNDIGTSHYTPNQILNLQRVVGNQAVQRIIQTKPKSATPVTSIGPISISPAKPKIQREPNDEDDDDNEQITRSNEDFAVNEEDYDEDLDDSGDVGQITRQDEMSTTDENNNDNQEITRQDEMSVDEQQQTIESQQNTGKNSDPNSTKKKVEDGGKGAVKLGRKGWSIADKASFIKNVKNGSEDGNILPTTVFEGFEFALSEGWTLGKLITAIKKLKSGLKRRAALKEASESHGIIGEGKYKAPYTENPQTEQEKDSNKLAEAAWYGFSKVKRLVWMLVIKIALKLVKMVMHVLSIISGGTSALVTESIALGASVASGLKTLITSGKGVYKALKGTRGANRKKNADTMVDLAIKGNKDAAELVLKLNPFDGFTDTVKKKLKNGIRNKIGVTQKIMDESPELIKPNSVDEFIEQLQNPNIYTPDVMKALRKEVAGKLKSK